MQKFSDVVLDKNGKAIAGATVTVSTYPDSLPATIYAADGGPAVSSVSTDNAGRFAFYAANGHYSITVSGQGITPITYNDVTLFDPKDLSANSGAALVGFSPAGAGGATRTVLARLRDSISVKDFGALGNGINDDTAAIQAAVDFACSLVVNAALGDPVSGATVLIPGGVYKITQPIIVNKGNVEIVGSGGATINPYFPSSPTLYNIATPVFIVGSALAWYTTSFTNTNKYNAIRGLKIKAIAGQGPYIGVLLTGTRNATVANCLIENPYIGLLVENTSELDAPQVSVIGSTYSVVLDNRKVRSAANSVLKTACTSNDVSSCNFYMLTSYYAQRCPVLAINTGTIGLHGATIGQFAVGGLGSELGFPNPTQRTGIFIYGDASGNFTRGFYASNVVFEADPSMSSDCVRIETTGANSPISGVTLKNCHVQTYASTPGGAITNFLRTKQVGGAIAAVSVENCGYTPQSSGYNYGTMHTVDAGYPVVKFRGCYPDAAFNSMGNDFGYYCKNMDVVEIDNIVPPAAFPPAGWTANGVAGALMGGSAGQFAYLRFTGSTSEMSISKTEVYREQTPHLGNVWISFLARGDAGLLVRTRINGQSDSDSTTNNATNQGRYGNAIVQPTVLSQTNWQRVVYCFNQFDDGSAFDNVTFTLGKGATASASNFIEIADVRIGYTEGGFVKYNPFS